MIARLSRSSMLEVLRQDYVRTSRAKGMAERVVIYKHALKNALLPVTTALANRLGDLLGGSMITETVFAYPGLGMLMITAIKDTDYPVVQGVLIFTTLTYVVIFLIADIVNAYIDPRVQYE
jgi:ABC-type dipeptide/oligopeptide/nickel transport system permease component